jgi:D-arabinose 5-phosphate isomerase GutQ
MSGAGTGECNPFMFNIGNGKSSCVARTFAVTMAASPSR